MENGRPLDMKFVFKRGRMLDKRRSDSYSLNESYIENLITIKDTRLQKDLAEEYISRCSNTRDLISALEAFYANSNFNLLELCVESGINDIIPREKNVKGLIPVIEAANIGDVNKDRLIETCKMYKSIDRILENHTKLSKRFDVRSPFSKGKSIQESVFDICRLVDTYTMSPFIKINIALEEVVYLSYMDRISLSEEQIIEPVLDYFMLRESNTKEDIDSYKRALQDSKVLGPITEEMIKSNSTLSALYEDVENDEYDYHIFLFESCDEMIGRWKVNPNKNVEYLTAAVNKKCYNESSTAVSSIVNTIAMFNSVNESEYDAVDTIYSLLENSNEISSNTLISIAEGIEDALDNRHLHKFDNDKYEELADKCKNDLYTGMKNQEVYDGPQPAEPVTFSSDEIKSFHMSNLISDAQDAGEFLDRIPKNEFGLFARDLDDSKYISESNFKDYIDEDGHISVLVRSFSINRESALHKEKNYMFDLREFADTSVKCMNNILGNKTTETYAIVSEDTLDFFARTKYGVFTSIMEDDNDIIRLSNYDKENFLVVMEASHIASEIAPSFNKLTESLNNGKLARDITLEQFRLLDEITASIGYNIDFFIESADYEGNKNINIFKKIHESKKDFICPMEYIPEACDYANQVISEGNVLNTIKLGWRGFLRKVNQAKNVGSRVKENIRDATSKLNHFLKSAEDFANSHAKDTVIDRQLIPAMKALWKTAIPLAAAGIITQNPAVSMVGAVIALVNSGKTSKDAKYRMVQELDTELKVLDRSIQNAESNGSTEEYRNLLRTRDKLKNQRAKIKYGMSRSGMYVHPMGNNNN